MERMLRVQSGFLLSERINPIFGLRRYNVDIELISWRRQHGNVVRVFLTLKVMERRVDGLCSREIDGRVLLRWIELLDPKLTSRRDSPTSSARKASNRFAHSDNTR
jgi:hypothetical protein